MATVTMCVCYFESVPCNLIGGPHGHGSVAQLSGVLYTEGTSNSIGYSCKGCHGVVSNGLL